MEFLIANLQKTREVPGAVIEIGCYQGGTLLQIAKWVGAKKTVIGYDTFEGLPSPEGYDLFSQNPHQKGDFNNVDLETMQTFFADYGVKLVKGIFPGEERNRKISFAHLDVDLYMGTVEGLKYLEWNLAPNGLIVVDDYLWSRTPGVEVAVEEFLVAKKFKIIDQSKNFQVVLGRP